MVVYLMTEPSSGAEAADKGVLQKACSAFLICPGELSCT